MLSREKGHVRGSRTTAFGEGDVDRESTAAVGPQRGLPAMTRRGHAKRGEFRDRCLLPDLRMRGDIWPTNCPHRNFLRGGLVRTLLSTYFTVYSAASVFAISTPYVRVLRSEACGVRSARDRA